MRILALETTGDTASIAIVDGSGVTAEFSINRKKNHSLTLMPLVSYGLEASGLTLADCSHIALGNGPGSFTGLRLSASTAKALAHGAGLPIVPVPTLDALAYNIFMDGRVIAPVMDARRSEVYACIYLCEKEELKPLSPYVNERFDIFLDRILALNTPVTFLGDGCFVHREAIEGSGFTAALDNNLLQRASSVGLLALKRIALGYTVSYKDLELMYLRKPQAERELEARA